MNHLFACWDRVAARLRDASSIALFLDFDGTLAPIEARPEGVSIDPASRAALLGLAHNRRFRISIISGRRRADVRARAGVPGVRYLGLHGWERNNEVELATRTRQALDAVRGCAERLFAKAPGVWIEGKEHTFSVHYRGAPDAQARLAGKVLHRLTDPGLFRLQRGKCVWEVIPRELGDKGTAALQELARLPGAPLPVYIGDDEPDEAAFIALRRGLTVLSGNKRRSRAQYRVAGVPEVRTLLRRLKEEAA